jgi:hypothetical protein
MSCLTFPCRSNACRNTVLDVSGELVLGSGPGGERWVRGVRCEGQGKSDDGVRERYYVHVRIDAMDRHFWQ